MTPEVNLDDTLARTGVMKAEPIKGWSAVNLLAKRLKMSKFTFFVNKNIYACPQKAQPCSILRTSQQGQQGLCFHYRTEIYYRISCLETGGAGLLHAGV